MGRTVTLAGLLALSALACAPQQQVGTAHRPTLKSVSVAPEVPMPELPRVAGKGYAAGTLAFGLIGGIIGESTSDEPRLLRDHLKDHGIDVRAIVREEFLRQSAATKGFPAVIDSDSEGTLQLAIEEYGLALGFSFAPINKPLSPTLRVSARLLAGDGRVLWERRDFVSSLSRETPAHKLDAYLADPALTRAGFKKAAQVVVKALLEGYGEEDPPAR